MKHRDEDELLAFALDVVASEEERGGMAEHLEVCQECRARLEDIKADVGTIAGVRPTCSVSQAPGSLPRTASANSILRAAALVAVGVIVGFGAASRFNREPVFVSPAYVETSSREVPAGASAASDATAIPDAYYDEIAD